jgi:hypothetical protein
MPVGGARNGAGIIDPGYSTNKSAQPDFVEAAVSAATLTEMQATRLPLQYKTKAPRRGGAL